jgi:hypothetical protein
VPVDYKRGRYMSLQDFCGHDASASKDSFAVMSGMPGCIVVRELSFLKLKRAEGDDFVTVAGAMFL